MAHSSYDLLKYLDRCQSQNESKRLLYVALTRAKTRIHCTARLENLESIPAHSFASYLQTSFQQSKLEKSTSDPYDHEDTPIGFTRLKDSWQSDRILETEAIDWQGGNRYIAETPSSATATGTVIHQILQELSLLNPLPEPSKDWIKSQQPQWQQYLNEHGHPDALDMVCKAIQGTLADPQGRWILQPHEDAHSEYALVSPAADGFQNHAIDRTFIADGKRWIIDYKNTPCDNPDDQFLQQQFAWHQAQLLRYAKLFKQHDEAIMLALYFPLCQAWHAQPLTDTMELDYADTD